jgi:zinc protease
VLEDDDEHAALAHFVEHMAFNGTEDFPKETTSMSFMDRSACGSGPQRQRLHSFDETVSTADSHRQTRSLDPLVAHPRRLGAHVPFDAGENRQGARRVQEEWRLAPGARGPHAGPAARCCSKDRASERLPIGKGPVIRTSSPTG